MDENEPIEITSSVKILGVAGGIGILIIGVIVVRSFLSPKLEPVDSVSPAPTTIPKAVKPEKFTAAPDVAWVTHTGKVYPYSFSAPETLGLTQFPNDVTDAYAVLWQDEPPQRNIMTGMDDLSKNPDAQKYIHNSKKEFAQNWWTNFGGLTGIRSLEEFTNAQGLVGYKARYINGLGETPNEDVFFEIPGHPELVLHFANGVLSQEIFDKIIDSVRWEGDQ